MLCLISLIGAVRAAGSQPKWPDARLATAPTKQTEDTIHQLERQGVGLEQPHRRALRALLRRWEERKDLRANLSLRDGTPDLPALLSWAGGTSDTDQRAFLEVRHELEDVSDRLGILSGGILRVLVASSEQRIHPRHGVDSYLWLLYQEWGRRPDLALRFAPDGIVHVRDLLWWAGNLLPSDPSFGRLGRYSGDYLAWLEALPKQRDRRVSR